MAGPGASDPGDIFWPNCTGLTIRAYGAVIDMFGAFHRTAQAANPALSNELQICPFVFRDARNLAIEGLEVDGNVDQMTRDATVVENQSNSCLRFESCVGVRLTDVYAHHAPSDNVRFSDNGQAPPAGQPRRACRDVACLRVRSEYAGRANWAVIQVRGLTAIECSADLAGRYGGTYGTHSPVCGVDVEPNRSATTQGTVDVDTGNIVFIRLRAHHNAGYAFVCVMTSTYHDGVMLVDPDVDVGPDNDGSPYCFALEDRRGRVIGGRINVRGREMGVGVSALNLANAVDAEKAAGTDVIYEGTQIRGTARILSGATHMRVALRNCTITSDATSPPPGNVLQVMNRLATLENCTFFVPAAAHPHAQNWHEVGVFNGEWVRETRFDTDLPDTGADHFYIKWGSAAGGYGATRVEQCWFQGRHGANRAWRPVVNSTWNNTYPYSRRMVRNVGDGYLIGANLHDAGTAAPSGDVDRLRGDTRRNTAPATLGTAGSQYVVTGWTCIASGNPTTATTSQWVESRALTGT